MVESVLAATAELTKLRERKDAALGRVGFHEIDELTVGVVLGLVLLQVGREEEVGCIAEPLADDGALFGHRRAVLGPVATDHVGKFGHGIDDAPSHRR
ncbi:hypothetical protein [Agromyces bauzanensis]|uniref:Uncharacterized protein n=1 Tax=Agromyces bauzanensis TaxID=1308924 RepID=A0A917UQR9_9MICO|nr:hypothetical protein [Agromyces bauzanensis]GGJ76663.1 hypothetical protein GCM10011372_13630 [Agromyces bauzanensis]